MTVNSTRAGTMLLFCGWSAFPASWGGFHWFTLGTRWLPASSPSSSPSSSSPSLLHLIHWLRLRHPTQLAGTMFYSATLHLAPDQKTSCPICICWTNESLIPGLIWGPILAMFSSFFIKNLVDYQGILLVFSFNFKKMFSHMKTCHTSLKKHSPLRYGF